MRAFAIAAGMTVLVAALGYAFAPAPHALLRAAGAGGTSREGAAASPPPESAPASTSAAAGGATAQGDAAPPSTRHVFFQWVDERGVVRFARTRDEVPAEWRERAGQVEVDDRSFAPKSADAPRSSEAAPRPASGRAEHRRAHDVTVYTAPWCGWCRKTLAWLDERGVAYVNKDIEANRGWAQELEEHTGGHAVPYVLIDGAAIRGYSPGKMAQLLD